MVFAMLAGCGTPASSSASGAESAAPASSEAATAEPAPTEAPSAAASSAEPQDSVLEEPKQELTEEQQALLDLIPEGDMLTFLELPLVEEKMEMTCFVAVHSMLLTMYENLSDMPFYSALEDATGEHMTFTAISSIDDAVREAAAEDHGTVSFATANPPICAAYLYAFIRSHPCICLRHFPMPFKRIREALDQGEIDFAISYDSLVSDTIAWDIIGQEEVLLLVSSAHPLAQTAAIPLDAVQHERFLFNNGDFGISEIGSDFCRQAGFEPKILFEGNLILMALQLVLDNLAVMFMSSYEYQWHISMGHPSFAHITPLHISAPICIRSIGLGYLKNRYLSPSAQLFIQGLRRFFAGIDVSSDTAPQ